MKRCQECGSFSSDEIVFCHVCGKRFPDTSELASDSIDLEPHSTDSINIEQEQPKPSHPEIIPLLQRIALFLEDGEFKRADDYCERVLDIEPTNADAYIYKLLVEFNCHTREQLENCTSSIVNSKNYAKVIRFGNEVQKKFVINVEKKIQECISKNEKETEITTNKFEEDTIEEIVANEFEEDTTEEILANKIDEEYIYDWRKDGNNSEDIEEDYIDIYCPNCREALSYTQWQINIGRLTCPICDSQFDYEERMRKI